MQVKNFFYQKFQKLKVYEFTKWVSLIMEERIWKGRKLIGKMVLKPFTVLFDIIYLTRYNLTNYIIIIFSI